MVLTGIGCAQIVSAVDVPVLSYVADGDFGRG